MKGEQLQPGAIGRRGDWGVRCCLLQEQMEFFEEDGDGEQSLSEG
jgi:hypothetical protein